MRKLTQRRALKSLSMPHKLMVSNNVPEEVFGAPVEAKNEVLEDVQEAIEPVKEETKDEPKKNVPKKAVSTESKEENKPEK